MLPPQQFAKELILQAKVLELRAIYQPSKTGKAVDDSLKHVPEQLCLRYQNFFNINKAEQQSPHWPINHAIELKPDSESFYMRIYNMSPAELKTLDEYLNKTLIKDWI